MIKFRKNSKKTPEELEKDFPEQAEESLRLGGETTKIQSSDTAREINKEEAISGIPYWLDLENIRDKEGRRLGDPGRLGITKTSDLAFSCWSICDK